MVPIGQILDRLVVAQAIERALATKVRRLLVAAKFLERDINACRLNQRRLIDEVGRRGYGRQRPAQEEVAGG